MGKPKCQCNALLNLVADIRDAVGDPEGKLMQDELVEHCRKMFEELRSARVLIQRHACSVTVPQEAKKWMDEHPQKR